MVDMSGFTLSEGPALYAIARLLTFAIAALAVAALFRRERLQVGQAIVLYAFALAARVASLVCSSLQFDAFARLNDFVALLLQGMAFINLALAAVFGILLAGLHFEPPRILRDLTKAAVYIALAFYLLFTHNVDLTGIVATSAVVTAVVGFSLQDVLGNVMGGIALNIDRSVRVGDWVSFSGMTGIVRQIGWRHTAIESRDGDMHIVPNSQLMKNAVTLLGARANGARQQRRAIEFQVDLLFAPSRVIAAVTDALLRQAIHGVAAAPAPDVIVTGIRDGVVMYGARYWLTELERDLAVDSAVRTRVIAGLERAQLPIGVPRSEVHLARERDENARVASLMQKRALDAISRVDIFSRLTPDERSELAARLRFVPFASDEAILVQGESGEYLVILARGSAEVTVSVEGGAASKIATLEAPDFCGEFGMLTGERRQANVVAATEVDAWRLSKEDFQEILAQRPSISEEVSAVLAERVVALRAARENLSDQARVTMVESQNRSIRERIERFFGLSG